MAPITILPAPKPTPTNAVLLRAIGSAPLETPRWLVKGLLPLTGVALLSGQYAAGKTFVAVDLSLSVLFNKEFVGRRVSQGAILWIAAEGGGEIDSRVEAARAEKFRDGRAGEIPFWITEPPAGVSQQGIISWLENAVAHAALECERFETELRLVVVDTLAACFGIKDENDNAEAASLMKELARIGNAHEVLIMPIAHHGKNAETGVRGASAYGAGADAILAVLASTDPLTGKTSKRSLALTKSRRGGTGPLPSFMVRNHVFGVDEDGDPISAGYIEFADRVEDTPGNAPKRRSRDLDVFEAAFNEVAISTGQNYKIGGDGPTMHAVPQHSLREEFKRRFVAAEPDKANATERQAWKRIWDIVLSERAFATERSPQGVAVVWRVRQS